MCSVVGKSWPNQVHDARKANISTSAMVLDLAPASQSTLIPEGSLRDQTSVRIPLHNSAISVCWGRPLRYTTALPSLIPLSSLPMLDSQNCPCHISLSYLSNLQALRISMHVRLAWCWMSCVRCEASGRNFGSIHQPHQINRGRAVTKKNYPGVVTPLTIP